MKVNILEAHDRFQHFKKQDSGISEMCQKIINQRPYGEHAFYIFAHARTIGLDEKVAMYNDDLMTSIKDVSYQRKYKAVSDVPEKRLIWQPRLTKPKSQPNSMLFKAYPGTDLIKIIWIIPTPEYWDQYEKDKMTQDETVAYSIYMFRNNREKLEAKEDDDLDDASIDAIYRQISFNANPKFEKIT